MLQCGPRRAAALWRKQLENWEVLFVPTSQTPSVYLPTALLLPCYHSLTVEIPYSLLTGLSASNLAQLQTTVHTLLKVIFLKRESGHVNTVLYTSTASQ